MMMSLAIGGLWAAGCATAPTTDAPDATAAAPAPTPRAAMHPGAGDASVCVCEDARARHRWCDHCGHGYIAGVRIESAMLFDTLDSHGHPLDPATVTCETCQTAMIDGGWCESCERGWVDGLAFMSRLTYEVSAAPRVPDAAVACPTCRLARLGTGWCPRHAAGWVGSARLSDRDSFEAASAAYGRLVAAVQATPRCELCACAIALDRRCPRCRVAYRDGTAIPADAP